LVALLLALLTSLGSFFELNKSELAAWVQAIGSIGAIIGAAWVATWQFKKHLDAQERAGRLADLQAARRLVALLCSSRDAVMRHRSNFLDSVRYKPHAEFNTYRTVAERERILVPARSELEFLLRIDSADLFDSLGRFCANIEEAISFLERRQLFFSNQLDPRVQELSEVRGRPLSYQEIALGVGPYLAAFAKANHACELKAIDQLCYQFIDVRPKILSELKKAFPDSKIESGWPESGELRGNWMHPTSHSHYFLRINYAAEGSNVRIAYIFEQPAGDVKAGYANMLEPLPNLGLTAAREQAQAQLTKYVEKAIAAGYLK
jgi:hypothetical protein